VGNGALLRCGVGVGGSGVGLGRRDGRPSEQPRGTAIVPLNNNGAWSWFMDPRVIVNEAKLIAGYVRAVGSNQANGSHPRWRNVDVSVSDIETGNVHNHGAWYSSMVAAIIR
jgi:hypothetical protein